MPKTHPIKSPDVLRVITRAIKDTIDAHGPITDSYAPSAAKRVAGALAAHIDGRPPKSKPVQFSMGTTFGESLDSIFFKTKKSKRD